MQPTPSNPVSLRSIVLVQCHHCLTHTKFKLYVANSVTSNNDKLLYQNSSSLKLYVLIQRGMLMEAGEITFQFQMVFCRTLFLTMDFIVETNRKLIFPSSNYESISLLCPKSFKLDFWFRSIVLVGA